MANTNNPTGLRPIRHRNGGKIVQNPYSIASAYATSLFKGDPVELTGTSMQIQRAAADNPDNLGVFAGVEYTNADGKRVYSKYWPASTVATYIVAFVWDDPQIIYECQYAVAAVERIISRVFGAADRVEMEGKVYQCGNVVAGVGGI